MSSIDRQITCGPILPNPAWNQHNFRSDGFKFIFSSEWELFDFVFRKSHFFGQLRRGMNPLWSYFWTKTPLSKPMTNWDVTASRSPLTMATGNATTATAASTTTATAAIQSLSHCYGIYESQWIMLTVTSGVDMLWGFKSKYSYHVTRILLLPYLFLETFVHGSISRTNQMHT